VDQGSDIGRNLPKGRSVGEGATEVPVEVVGWNQRRVSELVKAVTPIGSFPAESQTMRGKTGHFLGTETQLSGQKVMLSQCCLYVMLHEDFVALYS
jgi:hypothetical protein